MPFPEAARIELPILQELEATGGSDQLRYLYDRLVHYFPQLTADDLLVRSPSPRSAWNRVVQRAGRGLEQRGELRRERTRWTIPARGRQRVEAEAMRPQPAESLAETPRTLSHKDAQPLL